jgi:hypothetical protein
VAFVFGQNTVGVPGSVEDLEPVAVTDLLPERFLFLFHGLEVQIILFFLTNLILSKLTTEVPLM